MRKARRILLRAIAVALVVVLVGSLAYNAVTAPDDLNPEAAGLPGRFVDVAGSRTYVEVAGTGDTPVVLLHGFNSWSFTWREVLRALGGDGRFTAYALDMRGFGFTDRPADALYNVEGFARHVAEFLDAEQLERPILVGNSLGGEVAMRVVLNRPGRVRGLVLADSSPAGFSGWASTICRIGCIPPFHRTMVRLYVRHFLDDALRRAYFAPGSVDLSAVTAHVQRSFEVAGAEDSLLAMMRTTSPALTSEEVARIRLPTIVIWGERDQIGSVETGRRLAREITGARLITYPNTGHRPQEEQSDRFAADLIAFAGALTPRR